MSPRISILSVLFATACASARAPDVGVDAAPSPIPKSPEGTFAVASELDLASPIAGADVLADLLAATEGPDQPMRYVVDRMVSALPAGRIQTVAQDVAPLLAAYLEVRLAEVAPRLVTGIHALGAGVGRIARHVGTRERLQIMRDGSAARTITGLRFDVGPPVEVPFSQHGHADVTAATHVVLDRAGRVTIGDHVVSLDYGGWLRLGLDAAVIPSVVPGAHDLAAALVALIDCAKLGEAIAGWLGLGTPALYQLACTTGMTVAANELYTRIATLDATAVELSVNGAAEGVDRDGDGSMDELSAGTWSGTASHAGQKAPLGPATFTGARQ